jgi:hypothetical protein
MFFFSQHAISAKYGTTWTGKILASVHALGNAADVSGATADDIHAQIAQLPAGEPACLVGGYDQIPPFMRPNPTYHLDGDEDDQIPTDSPYGAAPGQPFEEYVPSRAVCRIPDGATPDPASFLKILSFQQKAPTTATPGGTFEEGAAEFFGALGYVHGTIPGADPAGPRLSPPSTIDDADLPQRMTQKGRAHVLLHGANHSPQWAYLFGHDVNAAPTDFQEALSCRVIDLCDLRGCIVTFSSCYAAMLDTGESEAPGRTEANQVALACLGHGAKVVYGATRSNWIDTTDPCDSLGPRLSAEIWRALATGVHAAEALRKAKETFLATLVDKQDIPYGRKTLLQFQCYGHPDGSL